MEQPQSGTSEHTGTVPERQVDLGKVLLPNESAERLFKRANTKPFQTGLRIFESEYFSASGGSSRGLRGADVVEIYGRSGVGKTELLLQVMANSIMPNVWRKVELGGEGAGVIYFDNDLKFNILRLVEILKAKLQLALAQRAGGLESPQGRAADEEVPRRDVKRHKPNPSPLKGEEDSRGASEASNEDSEQEVNEEAFVEECLKRLHLFQCKDSLQLLATLQTLDPMIAAFQIKVFSTSPRIISALSMSASPLILTSLCFFSLFAVVLCCSSGDND